MISLLVSYEREELFIKLLKALRAKLTLTQTLSARSYRTILSEAVS